MKPITEFSDQLLQMQSTFKLNITLICISSRVSEWIMFLFVTGCCLCPPLSLCKALCNLTSCLSRALTNPIFELSTEQIYRKTPEISDLIKFFYIFFSVFYSLFQQGTCVSLRFWFLTYMIIIFAYFFAYTFTVIKAGSCAGRMGSDIQ